MLRMKSGKMPSSGEVILVKLQFVGSSEIKIRPAVVLFEEYGNIVVVGITSNLSMNGIPLSKKEGAIKDSIIKINYIFTISQEMITKTLFHLNSKKKRVLYEKIEHKLKLLKNS